MFSLVSVGELDSSRGEELLARQRRFQLARLLRMSESMLDCARQGDWQKVEALEISRQPELQDFLALPPGELEPIVQDSLQAVLTLNQDIMTMVRAARNAVLKQHEGHDARKRAVQSYQADTWTRP